MKLPDSSSLPPDFRSMVFKVWFYLCEVLLPARVRRILETVLFQASPYVPVSLATAFERGERIRLFLTGYVATLAICFGGVVLTTHIDGTLIGTNDAIADGAVVA